MSSILEDLLGMLQDGGISRIGRHVDARDKQVESVVMDALPALLSGLARNTSTAAGADSLSRALSRDHDGSVLEDLIEYLSQSRSQDGAAILKHIFGGKQPAVEKTLAAKNGLDMASVGKILQMLAPVVLGYLGKHQKAGQLDSSGLGQYIGQEYNRVQRRAPQTSDLFTQLLDADGDGSVVDDIAGMLGGMLRDKR